MQIHIELMKAISKESEFNSDALQFSLSATNRDRQRLLNEECWSPEILMERYPIFKFPGVVSKRSG